MPTKVTLRGGWNVSTLSLILKDENYTATFVWNRTTSLKDPLTGRIKKVERPKEEWVTQQRAESVNPRVEPRNALLHLSSRRHLLDELVEREGELLPAVTELAENLFQSLGELLVVDRVLMELLLDVVPDRVLHLGSLGAIRDLAADLVGEPSHRRRSPHR